MPTCTHLRNARISGGPPVERFLVVIWRVHVSQNQSRRIDVTPVARRYNFQTKLLDRSRDFADAARQSSRDRTAAFVAIYGGQRFEPSRRSRNDGLGARMRSAGEQPIKPFRREVRHVASNDQIPARARCRQSSFDARQRTAAMRLSAVMNSRAIRAVTNRAHAERRISARRSDDRYRANKRFQQTDRVHKQRSSAIIEKPFIAAHAGTRAPCENEPSNLGMRLFDHKSILQPRSDLRLCFETS